MPKKIILKTPPSSRKDEKKLEKNPNWWNISFIIIILVALSWSTFSRLRLDGATVNKDVSLTQIIANYSGGLYSEIIISWDVIEAKYKPAVIVENGKTMTWQTIDTSLIPLGTKITDLGISNPSNPTKVIIKDQKFSNFILELLPSLLSTILFIWLIFFILTRISIGWPGWPMSFGRNRAKLYDPSTDKKITFKDVAWADEEKADLVEVVDFLKNPKKYHDLGAKIPRGILLQGPPWTGKTLLARAVAGESDVPFFSISGSEFVEMFVWVWAARVRDLFAEAREKAPSIIFIDEIDAIGKRRAAGMGGWHDEREQTLNQILTEMDGFDNETHVIVMAATNRADVLDRALLRPWRFDRKVTIHLPTLEDRKLIVGVHTQGKPLGPDVNIDRIAALTVGFSGAEIANLLNEAAILAGKLNKNEISQAMIQQSVEKVVMGNEKKSLRMTEKEKYLTAIHEVWHALVGKMLPHTDPVHKISILPRGWAGGVTWFLPEKDRTYVSKAKYLDELACLYGWRVSEEIFFWSDYITTGASNDIEKATEIARAMVMRFWFDPELGAENYAPEIANDNFLAAENNGKVVSDSTQNLIDEKVRSLLKSSYEKARSIITEYRELHEKIAQHLIEKEEMLQEEFDAYFTEIVWLPKKVAF